MEPAVDAALQAWLEESSQQFDNLLGILHDAQKARGENLLRLQATASGCRVALLNSSLCFPEAHAAL